VKYGQWDPERACNARQCSRGIRAVRAHAAHLADACRRNRRRRLRGDAGANSAEAGALFAAKHGWNSAGISAAVVNATGVSGVTASPAPSEFCGCPVATGITATACTTACANGNAAGTYVQINAMLAHQTILTYPGWCLRHR